LNNCAHYSDNKGYKSTLAVLLVIVIQVPAYPAQDYRYLPSY